MKKAKIVVLAGQSNAVGVGHIEYLPRHFTKEKIDEFNSGYPDILINYFSHNKKSGGFTKTTMKCTEEDADTMGPEIGMADSFNERYPGQQIFIVKCAFGATSLFQDWLSRSSGGRYDKDAYADQKPDILDFLGSEELRAGWCYNELVKIVRESIDILKKEGYSPEIHGFCWMQGESDAFKEEDVLAYAERYEIY